ncbi:MAG: substrate-binding domain-containing protein [Lachnospiraceae bacterium]|nr:substrate-binding domain-containing protein [Lachnospiraceae bacterium]
MKKISLLILLFILSVLSMAGCSKQNNAADTDAVPDYVDFQPLTEIKEGRTDVYLIVKLIDSGYWQVIINGAKDAGDAYDCNVYYAGTAIETDWQGQHELIDKVVGRNADAIILAPDDSVELAPDIERIHNLNIPIILVDTAANTDSYDICYMTDNLLAGQNAAEEMIRQLMDTGHSDDEKLSVGIMVGSATSQTINERLAGFYQHWSSNAPKNWEIISDIKNCNGNIDLGGQLTGELFKDHADLAGLYGTNNGPTRALCRTVSDAGRTDIVVVGFDYSDEMKALLESPEYHASTMLQRQYDMSYRAVGTALELLKGIQPPVKFEDTGVVTVNSLTLNDPDVIEVLKRN